MNVNLDVLELIFAQLDGTQLVHAALVSRAFLAGAIPSLYSRIEYTSRHAKRAQSEMSPFATIAAHDHLGVHVKRIALHAAPIFQPGTILCPAFLHDLARALDTTTNLCSFVCAVKILPPLLPHLLNKPRLNHIRANAPLGSRQAAVLKDCTSLYSLCLDFPSWNVIDALPNWTADMQKTLAHLTLYMSQDTDAAVLHATLAQLPRLRGLHVIGCPRITHITVLKALSHTPDLRELSLTIFPSQDNTLPPLNFPVPSLTHLSIDVRASYPGLQSLIARIISRLSPRDALAICGSWIGEIKGSSEHTEIPPNGNGTGPPGGGPGPGPAGGGPSVHVWQSHALLHGGHGHNHANNHTHDPPLLSPATPHHGHVHPHSSPVPPLPNLGNHQSAVFGFSFPFPLVNHNDNNDDDNDDDPPSGGPPTPPVPDTNLDPNLPSLIDSLPSTLLTLHLPQISPAGLREVLDRCDDIQLLGFAIENITVSSISAKKAARFTGQPGQPTRGAIRPEIGALADILTHAKALRALIIDTSPADFINSRSGSGGLHSAPSGSCMWLTPPAVRMLMCECPLLRRIVAEGRVWESDTPTPSSPVPAPQSLEIQLSLRRAHYGPGAGYNHVHGPPGLGVHGSGYGQMELGNDHWFWLAGSMSGGKVYHGV